MSFFKKLFGISTVTAVPESIDSVTPEKVKRSVFDFFDVDLKTIPDESFIEGESYTNESGDLITNYRKRFDVKECGLFDTIEVILIQDACRNVVFNSSGNKKGEIKNVKKLIDDLFLIYGHDSDHKGSFSSEDLKTFNDPDFSILFGRNWIDSKYKHQVTIDNIDDKISLTIFGL